MWRPRQHWLSRCLPSLKITYSVECNDLDDALQLLYIKMQSLPLSMRLPLPSAPAGSHLPYVGGDVDFIADGSEDGGVQTARSSIAGKRENERSVECSVEGCTEVFPARLIRHHVAWHLLLGGVGGGAGGGGSSGSGGSGGGGDAPCGLCAVRPQMQFSAEGASGGGCPVWVEKKGKTLKPHFRCQSVGTVDFSMGSAAKSTSAQPSTNIPIQCPECGTKPMAQFFWKYKGMMAHWQRAHSTKTMPVELSEQLKISEKEKEGLVKFAKSSGAGAAKRKRASDAAAAPAATAAAARRLSAACEPK